MDLPFTFAWRFYPPSFYAHAFYQKKHLQVLDWSRPKAAFLSSHPTPSPQLSDTETALRFSRGTMKNSFHRSLFLMSLKKCPSGGGRAERDRVKKKGYLPRMIRARLLKGKGQFGVISLCPQVSFGTWQADCSTLLKQVSLDIEDLETGGGQ